MPRSSQPWWGGIRSFLRLADVASLGRGGGQQAFHELLVCVQWWLTINRSVDIKVTNIS